MKNVFPHPPEGKYYLVDAGYPNMKGYLSPYKVDIWLLNMQCISHILHGQEDLLSFTWRNCRKGTITNIVDPSFNNGSQNEIMRCIHISLLCVQENLVNRPTMANIALMLSSYSISLPLPLEPASFLGSKTRSIPRKSVNKNSTAELYPK
ncbi:hypothetical protein P8452_10609 [Trifolium repens]|nr:hypothetical protein P8452_10609 [Trifolium repens]